MANEGFLKIFWGLLFIFLDVRIGGFDLILPDFVGYILIFKGLGLLASAHPHFRKARVLAAIMIFASLPSLLEVKITPQNIALIKRQMLSSLTGDLSKLVPTAINSATLLRTVNARSFIDTNRTANPGRDGDSVLAEYSDGTTVLILRYGSSGEALSAMRTKADTDYSSETIRKRAETDESFRAATMRFPQGESSGSDDVKTSAYSNVEASDRVIQQWWNKGGRWWDPFSWQNKGGLSDRMLYVVEGYKSSAAAYKTAFEGDSNNTGGVVFNPLFPISIFGEILTALLIWKICSGVIALGLHSNNYDLASIARKRRALYMAFTVLGWPLLIAPFIAPEFMSGLLRSGAFSVLMVYVVIQCINALLITTLMRKAANTLQVNQPLEPLP